MLINPSWSVIGNLICSYKVLDKMPESINCSTLADALVQLTELYVHSQNEVTYAAETFLAAIQQQTWAIHSLLMTTEVTRRPGIDEAFKALRTFEILGIRKELNIGANACAIVVDTLAFSLASLKDLFGIAFETPAGVSLASHLG